MRAGRAIAIVLAAAGLFLGVGRGTPAARAAGHEVEPPGVIQETAAAAPQEAEVHPPALEPRQRVGVAVFLAWMWALIGGLLIVLRLKAREADRVFRTGFFEGRDSSDRGTRRP